ncbi:MAG: hypothetical protein QGH45_16860, partial [Myxococcota bacterium]|nr:hypothetical protein [Myxococcota bacterium]
DDDTGDDDTGDDDTAPTGDDDDDSQKNSNPDNLGVTCFCTQTAPAPRTPDLALLAGLALWVVRRRR